MKLSGNLLSFGDAFCNLLVSGSYRNNKLLFKAVFSLNTFMCKFNVRAYLTAYNSKFNLAGSNLSLCDTISCGANSDMCFGVGNSCNSGVCVYNIIISIR